MNVLGVGPLELILFLLIMFVVLGPADMVRTGKKLGRFLSMVRKSEIWRGVTRVNKTVRNLPVTLMREAELDDITEEIKQSATQLGSITEEFQINDLNKIVAERKASIEKVLKQADSVSTDETI